MQAQLDFTQRIENNSESQAILYVNKDKINKQCRIVLDAMQRGEKLTVRDALLYYGIGDLRRRIKDLKDYCGYNIKSETMPGGFKKYFL